MAMTVRETPGDRLTKAMKRAGLKNHQLAAVLGVDAGTVSRWRRDAQEPEPEKLDRIVDQLRERGVVVSPAWIRYGDVAGIYSDQRPLFPSTIHEDLTPPMAQRSRVWLEQFLLELTEQGADEDFIAWARRFLQAPANYALYADGTRTEMTEGQVAAHMQGLAVGVRAILKDRLKKSGRNEKARGKQD